MKKIGFLVVNLLAANTLFAQTSPLSYDFVEAGYGVGEILDEDFSFVELNASYSLTDNLFVKGSYADGTTDDEINFGAGSDDVEITGYELGLGFHTPLNQTTDVVASASYVSSELEFAGFSEDADGYAVEAGFRVKPVDNLEVNAFLNYYDAEGNGEVGYSVAAYYFVTPTFSLGLGYEGTDDTDSVNAGIRFHF